MSIFNVILAEVLVAAGTKALEKIKEEIIDEQED